MTRPEAIKRYLVFAGLGYYPNGGWDDFVGSYDTLTESVAVGKQHTREIRENHGDETWYHVIDTTTSQDVMTEIYDSSGEPEIIVGEPVDGARPPQTERSGA